MSTAPPPPAAGSDLTDLDDLAGAPDDVLDAIEAANDGNPAAAELEEELTEELLEDPPDPDACEPADAVKTAAITDLKLAPATAQRVTAFSLLILTLIALSAAMFLARGVFLPIAAAGVLNLLLSPLVRMLERWKLPPAVGAIIVLGGLGGVLAGLTAAVMPAVQSQLADAPAVIREVQEKFAPELQAYQRLTASAEKTEEVAEKVTDPADELRAAADPDAAAPAGTADGEEPAEPEEPAEVDVTAEMTGSILGDDVFNAARSLLTLLFATGVLLYFLLAAGNSFTRKCMELAPHLKEKRAVSVVIGDAQRAISNYLLTVTVINGLLGVVVGLTMWAVGMPNPVLWGVLAALFNFIPYVGAVFGAAIVALVAFGTFDGARVILPPVLYLVCTTLEGNFITPKVLGDRLNLNAPVIFAWLLLWGWLWGVPGALLAVPMLAALAILCQHIDELGPVGKFLVGE